MSSPTPDYTYLRFALMPFHPSTVVSSPLRPLGLNKRMFKAEFTETQFTIPAGGELEVIFMEGYISSTNSEAIALFYNVNATQLLTSPSRSFANKRTLIGKPASDSATCYVAGYLKVSHVSGTGPLVVDSRMYEPQSITSPANFSDVANVHTLGIRTNTLTNGNVFINCLPSELKAKRFSNLTVPDFHRTSHHFKVKNNGGSSATVSLLGQFWLETYDPINTGIFFVQSMIPAKLAEYILGIIKNSPLPVTDSSNYTERYDLLDNNITVYLKSIGLAWQMISSSYGSVPDEEDWTSRPKVSNN